MSGGQDTPMDPKVEPNPNETELDAEELDEVSGGGARAWRRQNMTAAERQEARQMAEGSGGRTSLAQADAIVIGQRSAWHGIATGDIQNLAKPPKG